MCGFVFCGTAIIVFYNTLQFITFPKAMNTHFYFSISLLVPIFTYLGGLFLFLFFSSNQNNGYEKVDHCSFDFFFNFTNAWCGWLSFYIHIGHYYILFRKK